jgi:4-amino-4-deoxy-L-arabinose transferase-like glycosyltransferase
MADRGLLRRAGTIAVVLAVLLTFAGLFQHGLWTPDEPREAEVGREMLLSKFSAMPTLAGESFLEKPPLGAWITAASYAAFGVYAAAARLPAALFAVGAICIAYLLGKRTAGRVAGLCTAAVAATMWQFAETTHKGVLDVELTFFIAAGHLAFLRLKDENRASNYVAIGLLSGLAFLTKAWIGPGLLCAPPILAAAALRDWAYVKRVLPRAFVASVVGVVASGLPWVMALVHTPGGGWEGVKTCLVTNTLGRSVGAGAGKFSFSGHAHWFGFYFVAIFQTIAPWILTAPAWFKGGTLSPAWRGGRSAFCGLMFVAAFLLLSIPTGKRELYLVPMLPALAVVPGVWLSRVGSRRGGAWDAVTVKAVHVVVTVAFVAIALAMGYAALGLPLPKQIDDVTRAAIAGERTTILVSMVLTGLWVLGPHAWAKRRLIPRTARGVQLAASTFTLMLILFGAAYPLVNPMRDMSAGARRIAELVPPGEKLLSLSADETTRAIVPFYSGRILEDCGGPRAVADITAELDAGTTRHIVVMDNDLEKIGATPKAKRKGSSSLVKTDSDPQQDDPDPAPARGPKLIDRLDLVEAVQVSSTRVVYVYKLKP